MAVANGVTFDPDTQLVGHEGWLLEKGAAQLEFDKTPAATALRDSGFHLIPVKIHACDDLWCHVEDHVAWFHNAHVLPVFQ